MAVGAARDVSTTNQTDYAQIAFQADTGNARIRRAAWEQSFQICSQGYLALALSSVVQQLLLQSHLLIALSRWDAPKNTMFERGEESTSSVVENQTMSQDA